MTFKLRLRDLENIASEKVDYSTIMSGVLGYKNKWFNRSWQFGKMFRAAFHLVREGQQIDPTKCEVNPKGKTKLPRSIDNISFKAMMELQAVTSNSSSDDIVEIVAEIITIVCYSHNTEKRYKEDIISHKAYRETILDSPLEDMMGLYNWIISAQAESKLMWDERFLSVEVSDSDYNNAGGSAMAQFNVINTIKSLCNDFNCGEEDAWQKSYGLSQTNSYSKATERFIQDNMRQSKEIDMERQRKRKR